MTRGSPTGPTGHNNMTMPRRRLVFLEFNELCPSLLHRWMDAGLLPAFKRFHDQSQVFTGVADVDENRFLEPWIQWYSLHTGLDYHTHHVFNLTDGPAAGHTDIWHALASAGLKVGNFAGMNSPGLASPGSFYVPDPWCTTQAPYPPELNPYQKFVLGKVQENSNPGVAIGLSDELAFARFLATHGLSFASLRAAGEQVTRELRDRSVGWQRASLLDQLQVDVFLHYWRKYRPDYASIFMNSTAHYQHAYFHLIDADQSPSGDTEPGDPRHRAVLFGYQQMDRFIDRLARTLEAQGAMLVLVTALSQQPNPSAGQRFYRCRDIRALFDALGIQATELLPVMSQQYSAVFATAADATAARHKLERLQVADRQVFDFGTSPDNTVFFGCGLHENFSPEDAVAWDHGTGVQRRPFFDILYMLPHTKSTIHHPESVIWFKSGSHQVHKEQVSILDIFPTVLDYYGVDTAPGDGFPRSGRSLVPLLGLQEAVTATVAR